MIGQFITLHDPGVMLRDDRRPATPNAAAQTVLDALQELATPMDATNVRRRARSVSLSHRFRHRRRPQEQADNFGWYARPRGDRSTRPATPAATTSGPRAHSIRNTCRRSSRKLSLAESGDVRAHHRRAVEGARRRERTRFAVLSLAIVSRGRSGVCRERRRPGADRSNIAAARTIVRQLDAHASLVGVALVVAAGLDRQTMKQNGLAALVAQTILRDAGDVARVKVAGDDAAGASRGGQRRLGPFHGRSRATCGSTSKRWPAMHRRSSTLPPGARLRPTFIPRRCATRVRR